MSAGKSLNPVIERNKGHLSGLGIKRKVIVNQPAKSLEMNCPESFTRRKRRKHWTQKFSMNGLTSSYCRVSHGAMWIRRSFTWITDQHKWCIQEEPSQWTAETCTHPLGARREEGLWNSRCDSLMCFFILPETSLYHGCCVCWIVLQSKHDDNANNFSTCSTKRQSWNQLRNVNVDICCARSESILIKRARHLDPFLCFDHAVFASLFVPFRITTCVAASFDTQN